MNNRYSSAIVIAMSAEDARFIHPDEGIIWNALLEKWCYDDYTHIPEWFDSWVNPNEVNVELIGVAHQVGHKVLCKQSLM